MNSYVTIISRAFSAFLLAVTTQVTIGCAPVSGPDKSAAGLVLGAGWGAGAGAVVGNQVATSGEGIPVGAGFGAIAGLLHGVGYDLEEGHQLQLQRQLASLNVQAVANQRYLEQLQRNFDNTRRPDPVGGVYQVFFDEDQTNIRPGAISNLEAIAESIKASGAMREVHVAGHTDDTGNTKYNETLADARAKTVGTYLASMGIPVVQIEMKGYGATKPIATNSTAAGRQLNRRVDVYISR
jgi:outer membrane protein OmpA-like peptidoglycan-associated protein